MTNNNINLICKKCGLSKPLSEFYKDKKTKSGFWGKCKKCLSIERKKYYQTHKDDKKRRDKKHQKTNPFRWWAGVSLQGHKDRGCIINIKLSELEKLAKETKKCPICNIKLNWDYTQKRRMQPDIPNLDRIDNKKEINKNNVWIICWKCNRIKMDLTFKEFVGYCGLVYKKFNNNLEK